MAKRSTECHTKIEGKSAEPRDSGGEMQHLQRRRRPKNQEEPLPAQPVLQPSRIVPSNVAEAASAQRPWASAYLPQVNFNAPSSQESQTVVPVDSRHL
eukprot:Skav225839  [mRNA]  locus=scaffold345:110144:111423:+ [translate_table: standard]